MTALKSKQHWYNLLNNQTNPKEEHEWHFTSWWPWVIHPNVLNCLLGWTASLWLKRPVQEWQSLSQKSHPCMVSCLLGIASLLMGARLSFLMLPSCIRQTWPSHRSLHCLDSRYIQEGYHKTAHHRYMDTLSCQIDAQYTTDASLVGESFGSPWTCWYSIPLELSQMFVNISESSAVWPRFRPKWDMLIFSP